MQMKTLKKRLEKFAFENGIEGRLIFFEAGVSDAKKADMDAVLIDAGEAPQKTDQYVQLIRPCKNETSETTLLQIIGDDERTATPASVRLNELLDSIAEKRGKQ